MYPHQQQPFSPHQHSGWPYPMYHYHRGPRRIFWFFLGGLAATLWLKHKEKERCLTERTGAGWWNSKKWHSGEAEGERWREEREKLAKISSQATDTAADVSEAALDTILSTVETLKLKLAEHRKLQQKEDHPADPSHRV
ncbi:hypothetical protein K439DRAFT_1631795 [Ramaria rubella]|nr:hypothetical protein K439DRAFT_1631795 [Ramaria rubella]